MFRRFFANAAALAVAAFFIPGIHLVGDDLWDKVIAVLLVALVFGVLNALVKPVLQFLSAPLIILTLGLFLIVVNMAMLMLTSWVCGKFDLGFHVDGWFAAFLGSLLISAVSWAVNGLFQESRRD